MEKKTAEKEEKNLELMSKEEVADEILNYILEMKQTFGRQTNSESFINSICDFSRGC